MNDIVKILIFSAIAYLYLFLIAKIMGKKQIAQLNFIDYVLGITIGSIAAEMATELKQDFYHYLIAMTVFLVIDIIINLLSRKGPFMKMLLSGKPLILIDDGKLDYDALKRSKLTVNELVGMVREKGYFDISKIAYAIFETGGKLSVLPKETERGVITSDLDIKTQKANLPKFIIMDGHIKEEVLSEIKKNQNWILQKMKMSQIEEIKKVAYAIYDEENDGIIAQLK